MAWDVLPVKARNKLTGEIVDVGFMKVHKKKFMGLF